MEAGDLVFGSTGQHGKIEAYLSSIEIHQDDVCTVQNALRLCDPDQLLMTMLWGTMGWRMNFQSMQGTAQAVLRSKMRSVLDLMLSLPQEESPHKEFLLIPWQRFSLDDERGMIHRALGAALLDMERIPVAEELIRTAGGPCASLADFQRAIGCLQGADPLEALDITSAILDVSELAERPWPETLGRSLWLPRELTFSEKHMVLGHIVWGMTYQGFGIDQAYLDEGGSPVEGPFAPFPDSDYIEKMSSFTDILNYGAWVDTIRAASALHSLID